MLRITAATVMLLLATTTTVHADFVMDKTKSTAGSACAVANNRLYAFGGYLAKAGGTESSMINGIYSIDLSQPFSTTDPPVASHGVIDASIAGIDDMNAIALGDGKILIAGGSTNVDINNSTFLFNPSDNSIASGSGIKSGRYPRSSSMAHAVTAAEKLAAVPIYGGVQPDKSHASSMLLVTSSSSSVVTSRPADLVPREFASVMRFNSSHLLVSGGFGDDYQKDAWLFDEASQSWTKAKWTMTQGRYFHRSVLYGSKPYLITIGGYSSMTPYTLVESVDLSAKSPTSTAGTVVNADDGPKSVVSGCMTTAGDTLVYLGGTHTDDAGTNGGIALPLVSLLKIESTNNRLQFRWITDFKPAAAASPGTSSSGNGSEAGGSSASGANAGSLSTGSPGLSTGAIVGIAIGAAVVGAAAVTAAAVNGFLTLRALSTSTQSAPPQPQPQPQLQPQPRPTYAQPQEQHTWAHQQTQTNAQSLTSTPVPLMPAMTRISEPTTLVSKTGVGYLMDPDTMQRPQSSVSGPGQTTIVNAPRN
ncbi:hypothetical protein GGF32_004791 [Allomyces javanicus]|nr:hypothetical protein GGF32_004791 [Allomyces javanicus]